MLGLTLVINCVIAREPAKMKASRDLIANNRVVRRVAVAI